VVLISKKKEQITIAVVGDVHNQWDDQDEQALQHLGVDLVLFVGDFGNEAVAVVRKIAEIQTPKAVVMGNHDAWYSASSWGRQKAPYDQTSEDRVQQQLDLLGEAHVGFSQLDFADYHLSVVGSRPFSWGGSSWRNAQFYGDRYNVNSFEESTRQIVTAAENTTYDNIIIIGHNGPYGLGDKTESICGRDWKPDGGDYGDPDLTKAIADIRNLGKSIPLVTFGHMHHALKHPIGKRRNIVVLHDDTVYLNAACVPRVVKSDNNIKRSFSLVSFGQGVVKAISLVWLNSDFAIQSEEILYSQTTYD
jgi:uncharacterized protein (TIGR04168 family)